MKHDERKNLGPQPPQDSGPELTPPASQISGEPGLEGLTHRTDWESIAKAGNDQAPAPPPSRSFLGWLGHAAKTALGTASVWSGSGAAVICIGSSVAGVIGHAVSTVWTLRNELRNQETAPERSGSALPSDSILRRGFVGLIRDTVRSPGFNMFIGAVAYTIATVQATSLIAGAAFASFVLGQAAVTNISNLGYTGERTTRSLVERGFRAVWNALPETAQNLLRNPAPWYSLGNILIVTAGLDLSALAEAPAINGILGLGIGIATVSLGQSVLATIRGTDGKQPAGNASYVLGAGNFLLGLSSVMRGSVAVGIANFCWTVSNSLWGRALDRERKKTPAQDTE